MFSLSKNFPWPSYVGATSRVHTHFQTQEEKDRVPMLIKHEGLRFYLREIREVMATFDPLVLGSEWKAPVFFDWYEDYFLKVVKMHRECEEKVYLPEVEKLGIPRRVAIAQDHEALLQLLEDVGAFRWHLNSRAEVDAFHRKANELVKTMEDYLEDEEWYYPKEETKAGLTAEQRQAMTKKMLGYSPMSVVALEMPLLLYSAHMWYSDDTQEVSDFFVRTGLPSYLYLLINNSWGPDFFNNSLGRLEALQRDTPFQAKGLFCSC